MTKKNIFSISVMLIALGSLAFVGMTSTHAQTERSIITTNTSLAPASFAEVRTNVTPPVVTDTRSPNCLIEDVHFGNASNNYEATFNQFIALGFTAPQVAQVMILLGNTTEEFSHGDDLDIQWEIEGSHSNCGDIFSEIAEVSLVPLGSVVYMSNTLDDNGAFDIEDEEGEYPINNSVPIGFYRAYVTADGYPSFFALSDEIIYVNAETSAGSCDASDIEIDLMNLPSDEIDISLANSSAWESQPLLRFSVENDSDCDVVLNDADIVHLSNDGGFYFEELVAASDNMILGRTYVGNSERGKQENIDFDNFAIDSGDTKNISIYGNAWDNQPVNTSIPNGVFSSDVDQPTGNVSVVLGFRDGQSFDFDWSNGQTFDISLDDNTWGPILRIVR